MKNSSVSNKISKQAIQEYRGQLLHWYDRQGRELPWRYKGGAKPDPYRVWLSEIMCQQTTVQAVKPYYTKFLAKWPNVADLAAAEQEEVMREWAGLGYYARARNLHKCAQTVANDLNGRFPATQDELKALPGIGDYTSAAIAAIAFNEPATVMDGNIERVISRFFALEEPLPKAKAKPIFKTYTAKFFEGFTDRPGDLAQAFMDLGAGICTSKSPKCMLCPIQKGCVGFTNCIHENLPRKMKAKTRPHKFGEVYWIKNENGEILFEKRQEKGLLGGMIGLPTSTWETKNHQAPAAFNDMNFTATNREAHHTFTHFDLTLSLKTAHTNAAPVGYFFAQPNDYADALPTVFAKAHKLFSSS